MHSTTNRLIAIVLVMAAVLIGSNVLSLYALTESADNKRDLNNQKLVESIVSDYTETMLTYLSRVSVSDTAFNSVYDGTYPQYFASECKTRTLAGDISTYALVNRSNKVLFICEYGSVKSVSENSYMERTFKSLIQKTAAKSDSVHKTYNSIAPDYVFFDTFLNIGDRTYLALTTLINPDKSRPVFDGYEPVYSVSLINVKKVILDQVAARLPLALLDMTATASRGADRHYVPVTGDWDEPLGFISWRKSYQFNSLFMTFLPSIAFLSAISFLLIVRYLMRIGTLQTIISRQEAEARHASLHDSMTGLPNRTAFNQTVDEAFAQSTPDKPCFLGFFDLDYFKQVNDTHGHDAGDAVLIEAASRLRDVLGEDNFVARIGGDEFAFVIRSTQSQDGIRALCQKLDLRIKTPFAFAGTILKLSASIGIAEFPANGLTRTDVLKAADHALYTAKERGRGRFHVCDQTDLDDIGIAAS